MIIDLAVILAAAAISTLLFSRFKQPIVLGYLIAGFIVGSHSFIWPRVLDTEGIQLWAEIGVIFLLFGLGLEFSFKKLAKVGKSASIAALCEVITMMILGYLFGRFFGWKQMDSLFLGAILSMSSTTIIIRAFGEAGLKGKSFASLVFGILIVEDLIAIILMVFLTAISGAESFSSSKLVYLTARLGFFLLIWFLVGIYILPTLLKKVKSLLSNEIMLILSLGLCFIMVVLATKAGFSAALGAFIMGSILAETHEGERIEHLLLPVKDLFAAVFFVSVGMLIDPTILREYFGIIVLITLLTIVGKLFGSGIGSILSGRSLRHSVQAGMSLAQIGEFSFIIAALGVSLNVTSAFLYPIVIAVSAVTTFTTPYMIKYSEPIYFWIEKKLPDRFLESLAKYELAIKSNVKESSLGFIWRFYGIAALLNSVVAIAIGLLFGYSLLPFMLKTFGDNTIVRLIGSVMTLIFTGPFLAALVLKVPRKISVSEAATLTRLRNLQLAFLSVRILIAFGITVFVINQFSSTKISFIYVLVSALILMFVLRKYLKLFYGSVEKRFLANLNAKELLEMEKMINAPKLAPWDATLINLVLSSDSVLAGLTLEESQFRTKTGATVAMIDRGKRRLFAPNKGERLLPNDHIFLIGTEEQLSAAQDLIEVQNDLSPGLEEEMIGLESVFINQNSFYANKSIREIGMNGDLGGLIVGIERNDQRILSPESSMIILPEDLIWIFGDSKRIDDLKKIEE